MKNPRSLLWLIIFLTIVAVFINLPSSFKFSAGPLKFNQAEILSKIKIDKKLDFRKGLDLEGGTSITLRADMKEIPSSQKEEALNSAQTVIERRVNLFGVAEPIVQTSIVGEEYRVIVELPGVTDLNEVKKLIGTTAQLTFWEEVGTDSAKVATPSAGYPLNLPLGYEKTNLSGNDLKQADVGFNQNTGKPQVLLTFNSKGSEKFAEITERVVGKRLAIALDNLVIEAPTVNEAILGGSAEISGGFTVDSAKALATQLNAGALPVPLSTLQSHVIGPTLGLSSLQKSLFAGVLGFLVIVIFMVVLYGTLGVIASIALVLYTLFVLAIFKASSLTPYGVTLTLSGIAGFILSIGMAVDANILIFERMKEELRAGKGKKVAMEMGFSRAWTSIRDSNISTLITSAVLYKFGTGTVRGFALVLALGVLVSMFSAIVVTKTLLRLIYK
ncbi:MAG: protein translocase subunit SecD [Candidatus Levyibacteriota bacterium]